MKNAIDFSLSSRVSCRGNFRDFVEAATPCRRKGRVDSSRELPSCLRRNFPSHGLRLSPACAGRIIAPKSLNGVLNSGPGRRRAFRGFSVEASRLEKLRLARWTILSSRVVNSIVFAYYLCNEIFFVHPVLPVLPVEISIKLKYDERNFNFNVVRDTASCSNLHRIFFLFFF